MLSRDGMSDDKVFRDPIHGLVTFDVDSERTLLDVIDAPEFQRLRRISQLGLSSYTYPTSTHTRFSHLLGVSHLAGRIFDQVAPESISVTDEDGQHDVPKADLRLVVRLAGLLHDVGHGPYSHAFESVFKFDHEKMTMAILRSEDTGIARAFANSQNAIVREKGREWVVALINHTFQPTWVVDIISSQLDADRLDYLLRDAYMCGVSYANFDLGWIVRHMEIGTVQQKGKHVPVLTVNERKGLSSLEDFVMARYHMYEHVYYHKTTRGFEAILILIFNRVKELLENGDPGFLFPEILALIEDPDDVGAFLSLDEQVIGAQIQAWARGSEDPTLKKLATWFVNRVRFKLHSDERPTREEARALAREFEDAHLEIKYHAFEDSPSLVAYKDNYLLGKGESEHVWVEKEGGKVHDLAEASPVVGALRNRITKRDREYVSPDFLEWKKRADQA